MSSLAAQPERAAPRAIARIWRGRTLVKGRRVPGLPGYVGHLEGPGDSGLGVTVLRRNESWKTEFLVMSIWESVDAIKKFAGEDYQKAVILPRDREYLLEVDPKVLHYEILREERGRWDSRRADLGPRSSLVP